MISYFFVLTIIQFVRLMEFVVVLYKWNGFWIRGGGRRRREEGNFEDGVMMRVPEWRGENAI